MRDDIRKIQTLCLKLLDTIEEKISEILKQKSELATSVLSDAGGEITTKLSPEELLKAMKFTKEIK